MLNIPLAIVTFQPDSSFYCDLQRYIDSGEVVYIFCNCIESYSAISNKYAQDARNIKYFYVGRNVGLAGAYNLLLDQIVEDGYSYFCLFDQDTKISDLFFTLKNRIPTIVDLKDTVLAQLCSHPLKRKNDIMLNEVMFVINSGSLVNASLMKSLGGYPEDYFVDGVDYFVCLKAKLMNLKVGYVSGNFGLDHTLDQGDISLTIFNKALSVRYYGLSRVKDVTNSHLKLMKMSLLNYEFRYSVKLLQFLFIFYLKNIIGLFLRK